MRSNKLFYGTVATALVAIGVVACSGGSTGSSGVNDDPGSGTGFVANGNTVGTIDVELNDSTVGVTEVAGFRVKVRDSNGAPVSGIKVSCDTEQGVALVEPSTGTEITDSAGQISGQFGCEQPGSFQMACRLPVGGNLRKFVDVVCTGSRPLGFTGFPGAGGGGLGGSTGGVGGGDDPAQEVSLSAITFQDGGEDNTRDIDLVYDTDCDDDGNSSDPEPFSDTNITVTINNRSGSTFVFNSYKFVVPNGNTDLSTYRSPIIALTGQTFEVGPQSEESFLSVFAHQINANPGQDKSFVGSNANINSQNTDVSFVVYGEDSSGNSIELTGKVNLSFANFNRCATN